MGSVTRSATILLTLAGALGCHTYPCPQDVMEDSQMGDVNIAGADLEFPGEASARLTLSDLETDHDNVLDLEVDTRDTGFYATFKRPATTGTFRFEDLVQLAWSCPATAGTQFGDPMPSCSDEGGTVDAPRLALSGTIDLTDDDVAGQSTFNLTATFHLTSAAPAAVIDLLVHTKHATITETCSNPPFTIQ